jgi:MazG family protein
VRRHPHVFGEVDVADSAEVHRNWERIKREEKSIGALGAIPKELPALARAAKIYRRAVGVGFSFETVEDVMADLEDEVGELRTETTKEEPDPERVTSELGDVLFSAVCVGQRFGIEPETALRTMLDRFQARFSLMESNVARDGRELESLSKGEWEQYWDQAKRELTQ